MDNIYTTKDFKRKLQQYEVACDTGSSVYLDADDLATISQYYHDRGDINKAIDTADLAVALYPGETIPLALRARIELLDFDDPDAALGFAERIEDKEDEEYAYLRAEIDINLDEVLNADKFLERFMLDNIDEEDHDYFAIDVATLFADYGYFSLAEKWLMLSTATDDEAFQEIYARIALQSGNYQESERVFDDLVNRDPFSVFYWNGLATSQYSTNKIAESLTSSEYALAIDPNNADATRNKAIALCELDNLDGGIKYFKRYLELAPDDITGHVGLAHCYIATGNIAEARKCTERVSCIVERNRIGFCLLAVLYIELRNEQKAVRNIEQACRYDPESMIADNLHPYFPNQVKATDYYKYTQTHHDWWQTAIAQDGITYKS